MSSGEGQRLLACTVYFRAKILDVDSVPARSVLQVGANDAAADLLVDAGKLKRVGLVSDIGQNVCGPILKR